MTDKCLGDVKEEEDDKKVEIKSDDIESNSEKSIDQEKSI